MVIIKNPVLMYLCDDEMVFLEKAEKVIKALIKDKREIMIETFSCGEDLIERWTKVPGDVVFLDIDMPFLDGFEVAEWLRRDRKDVLIIFLTSREDMVYQSWEFQPFWFVRKRHVGDLQFVLPKLLKKIDYDSEKKNHLFRVRTQNCIVELDVNTVISISAYKHYVIIKDEKKGSFQYRCKISDIEEQTESLNIIRVQSGILVNCRQISKVTSREVILINGERIGLGRERIDTVKNRFQEFLRSNI